MCRDHLPWGLAFAIVCGVVGPAAAAEPDTRIAFVDLGRAFDEYEKTKRLDHQLEESSTAKHAEREQMVTDIRRMKDDMELLSEKGREERQGAIDDKIQRLQEFDRQARDGLKRQRDEMVKDVLKEIERVVGTYAQQHGYTLVLNDRAVLYAGKSADITDQVLEALNGPAKAPPASAKAAEKGGAR
ncbi:MAG: OmpH family outer membrane protein [Candidatus Omnitrophica bacterium]|nr:OmpH family outer membrane protein [Candidatus Omnitrophota bacterium]